MFVTTVAKYQMTKGVYCSKNGTNTALQTVAALMSIRKAISNDQSYSSKMAWQYKFRGEEFN